MQWLRQMNVGKSAPTIYLIRGHHSKVLTIGDCTKDEVQEYYNDRLLPDVPSHLRRNLDFSKIYDYFGGKLAHWSDFLTDYSNQDGQVTRLPQPQTYAEL